LIPEDDPDDWDGVASALAVGWLEFLVSFLRMHGSYQLDQIDNRETENGVVETVNVFFFKDATHASKITCWRIGPMFQHEA